MLKIPKLAATSLSILNHKPMIVYLAKISQCLVLFHFSRKKWMLFYLMLGFSAIAAAQNITLDLQQASLKETFQQIEKQTEFSFIYGEEIANSEESIDLKVEQISLDQLLDRLQKEYQLNFNKVNNNIAVTLSPQPQAGPTKVSGVVKDKKNGETVPAVTVYFKGIAGGTSTDFDGKFSLTTNRKVDSIVFSFIGFKTQTLSIGEQRYFDISLEEEKELLEEVVVVGYGEQSKVKVTSAISKLDAKEIQEIPVASVEQAIAGRLAGVQITQGSGAPGGSSQISIRGVNTLSAGTSPLLVIDGLPVSNTNLNDINPGDIQSIEVLKDAASASIYGSRGSNGVILITTKKGTSEKTQFQFSTYYGLQRVANKVEVMDAYEWSRFMAAARNNAWIDLDQANNSASDPNGIRGGNKYQIPEYVFPYLEGQRGLVNTDWQDEIFRVAPISNYELSAQGKSKGVNYYLSGSYFDQEGVIIGSSFRRYTFRSSLEAKLHPKLKIGVNLSPSYFIQDKISEKSHKKDGVVLSSLLAIPVFSARDANDNLVLGEHIANGQYNTTWTENPVAYATEIKDQYRRFRFFGGTYLEYEPIERLKYRVYLGGEVSAFRENYFRPSDIGTHLNEAPSQNIGRNWTGETLNWVNEHTLKYRFSKNEVHRFEVLGGFTAQKESFESSFAEAVDFPNDEIQTLNNGITTTSNTFITEWSMLSYLSRFNYDYKDKYLFQGSIRKDGSSRFGKDSRWGWFPSVSAGWRLTEESFMKKYAWLNELKWKTSYGIVGNNNIGDYASIALLQQSNYILNGAVVNGQSVSTSPNRNLSWEENRMFNIGFDAAFFKQKVELDVQYYRSVSQDLLLNIRVPASSGYTESLQNLGKVKNDGYEITTSINHKFGPINMRSSVNLTINRNEVLELGPGQDVLSGEDFHITQLGNAIGTFYGYRVLGVFSSAEQIANTASLPTSQVGSYIYEDINGDGEITDQDRTIIGDAFPDYVFGFTTTLTYKAFDLSIQLQGATGYKIYNLTKAFLYSTQGWSNGSAELADSYYPQNGGEIQYSRPLTKPTDKLHERSDLMLEDGSYVRVRNITIGFTAPEKLKKRLKISGLRFYVSSKNPFTWTKYSGYNPEVSSWSDSPLTPGVDYGAYPNDQNIVLGCRLNF